MWCLYLHLEDQELQLLKSITTYDLLSRCSQETTKCRYESGGHAHYITVLSLLSLEQQSMITLQAMCQATSVNFLAQNIVSMTKYEWISCCQICIYIHCLLMEYVKPGFTDTWSTALRQYNELAKFVFSTTRLLLYN